MVDKKCPECRLTKPLSEFYKDKARKDGVRGICKKCEDVRTAKYRIENRDKQKNYDLKKAYGIGLDQYNIILSNQNDKCAICGKDKSNLERQLSVDHCHKTGNIRGLLCTNCNRGIGNFFDSIDLLGKAIKYLSTHTPKSA